ncbi:unnamed protein product [Penicillium olsonii]|nr:unnamed protein product [Penicillium olsonii]
MIIICKYSSPCEGIRTVLLAVPSTVTVYSHSPISTVTHGSGNKSTSHTGLRHTHLNMSLGLQVTLASQAGIQAQAIALPITVSVHNTAEIPVTILRWNSPLDPQAGVLGVFEVSDTTKQRTLPIPTIMVSRKLPPTEEDLVEIKADEKLDFVVNLPVQGLEEGHQYSVRAQGTWHAVWPTELANVTPQLQDQGDEKGDVERGDFTSNVLSLSVEANS